MFVETISMRNFKSFQSCTAHFAPGFSAVIGPNGSGKCVRGDSKVLLEDGRLLEIRELVEFHLSKYGADSLDDGSVLAANPEAVKVFSLNQQTLKVEAKPIQAFVKRTSPSELFEITLENGRKIVSTGYHPLMILKDGALQSLRADELQVGMVGASLDEEKLCASLKTVVSAGNGLLQSVQNPLGDIEVKWEKLASVLRVSGEEWVYDLTVEGNHNFLAEGMFVHNTNIIDAILFALGETRIRALRAKKTPDLIYKNARMAEVELTLYDGKERTKVSRVLRRDGKIKYTLAGKRVHKYAVENFLHSHNISSYNIIQQGQVQQIIEMNSKERRELVDNVANVLEYEQKKKEAINELDKVADRLKESSVILGEKEGVLQQLERDKADAQTYMELKKNLDSLKATLLYLDVRNFEVELENIINTALDMQNKIGAINAEIQKLVDRITVKQKEQDDVNKSINERSEGRQLVLQKELDEVKAEAERGRAMIEGLKAEIQRNTEKEKSLSFEKQKAHDEINGAKKRIESAQQNISAVAEMLQKEEAVLKKLLNASESFSSGFFDARKQYDALTQEMLGAKEKLSHLQAETGKLQEIRALKEKEVTRLSHGETGGYEEKREKVKKTSSEIAAKLKALEKTVEALVSKETALSESLKKLDEEIMHSKMKSTEAALRLQHSRDSTGSQSVKEVLSLKDKHKGIHGSLDQLISYDAHYAVPIQVSLGGRLNFVVVDEVRTAEKLIDHLKKNKLGRVSFIPLDKVKAYELTSSDMKLKKEKGAKEFVFEALKFDKKFQKAIQFACTNTLICSSLGEAEGLVGKARLVTMEGELVEQSALITGGSFTVQFNLAKEKDAYEVYDKKWKAAKEQKETVVNELYSLGEELSAERKKKAQVEVELKSCEFELTQLTRLEKENKEKLKDVNSSVGALKKEIGEAATQLDNLEDEKASLVRKLSDLNIKSLDLKSKIDVEKEQSYGIKLKELEKRVSDLKFSHSDYSNQLKAFETEHAAYEREFQGLVKQQKEATDSILAAQKAIKDTEAAVKKNDKLSKEKAEELKGLSFALEDLFKAREKSSDEIQKVANQKGKLEFERDKHQAEVQKQEVHKAVVTTNLTNLKAEYEKYHDAQLLEIKDKAELTFLAREAEGQLTKIGNVNLKAIEEYDERSKDFQAQKVKIEQLANEKQAILNMIGEIEGKKISTFMQAYNAVNENFMRLFSQIFKGKGSLYLENEKNPFEGGLTIKVQLENKDVKYLELMSGGEKSLIALVFLFSIQHYNPSSIYILDEADAALDQQNSKKLAELVKVLSTNSQFLVVTHNKDVYGTADSMVGVSMSKQGSQVVEVKLLEGGRRAHSSEGEKKEDMGGQPGEEATFSQAKTGDAPSTGSTATTPKQGKPSKSQGKAPKKHAAVKATV